MEFIEVDGYLQQFRTASDYLELEEAERKKVVFEANELLLDHIPESKVTKRIVGLQALFMLEGEGETFAMLRRQGVESYSVKGVSVSLKAAGIAPGVVDILYPSKAFAGRFY